MADIFLSYSRTDKPRVAPLVAALEAHGWSVWWDSALAPGEEFDQVTSAELDRCKAVLVVWTPVSVVSRWVRGEARVGADRGVLVPVRFENAQLPIDVRAIQTTDFDDWREDAQSVAFQRLVQSLKALTGSVGTKPAPANAPSRAPAATNLRTAICVLPFSNMSGDPEQEYFSDGISEDVITDLGKVSALSVVARNTAFGYKGKAIDIKQVARQLGVSHVLEGSVRKSGNRVRITAQLIDGATGNHIWAERYDRALADIFDLQDEISRAIVAALRVRLLPEEKTAIEQRGTNNPEAYKYLLMARHFRVMGNERHEETIVRLCRKAVELDSGYARAWAAMVFPQSLMFARGASTEDGWAAAQKSVALDPNLSEAHAAMARCLADRGRYDEAIAELATALRLDSESHEAHATAARIYTVMRRYEEAIEHYEKAAALHATDYHSLSMASQCHEALGNKPQAEDTAQRALPRIEKLIATEPDHGSALSHGASMLIRTREIERAREWIARVLVVDPNNTTAKYNSACAMARFGEVDAALDILSATLETSQLETVLWAKEDSDLDGLRDHPRFKDIMAKAEARLAEFRVEPLEVANA